MALDHYISQVHLKNFYAPELGEAFYASRKQAVRIFPQSSNNVCRIEQGSTNEYLLENRAVEEVLKTVEPYYNESVAQFENDSISKESVYVIACFVSYILTCSPAAMRIHSQPLKAVVEETSKVAELIEKLPVSPPSLGGKSLSDLIISGDVSVAIDPKYPQAIGITGILSSTNVFGNSYWEILHNPFPESPFFTSDFPVCIESGKDPRVLNRIIPLTPFLAVRIHPDIEISRESPDFNFNKFRRRINKLNWRQVAAINKRLVRCAESMVFSQTDSPWVRKFIERNANYRIETFTRKIPSGKGTLMLSSQRIAEYYHAST